MTFYTMGLLGGIIGLAWGADRFVDGASSLAARLGISPLFIGLTLVSLGTSLPELLVTLTATLSDLPDVAVGNVVGSNISNIALILGTTALVRPLAIHSRLLARELPLLIIISGGFWLTAASGEINRFEGLVLITGLMLFLVWMGRSAKTDSSDPVFTEAAQMVEGYHGTSTGSLTAVVAGVVALIAGSRLLVWGGVGIAHAFGVPELVIGLSLVALGTSLPELATTMAGAMKGEDDIAVGNIVGSNIFNCLAIIGIPAAIHPMTVHKTALVRDFPVMMVLTLALWPIFYPFGRSGNGVVNRFEGFLLLAAYIIYISYLFS
ncbi:MAG: calcium/sodium antiporter [bacterium]|nr:calcium/sodium antiporter [bacterium]MDT8367236.1 calcium/sodium antiporter [bacterium]